MKKRIITALILAVTVSAALLGCSEKTQINSTHVSAVKEDKKDVVKSADEQIKIIADNAEAWFGKIHNGSTYKYCVTDLDGNGRLEILCGGVGGSSSESMGGIYEINTAFDGVELCEGKIYNCDMTLKDEFFCRIDKETGKIYYEMQNGDRGSSNDFLGEKYAVILHNGKIDEIFLSSYYREHLVYEDVDVFDIKDYNGNEITKEQHEAIYDTYFEGYEKKTVTLGWHEAERLSYEEWYKTQDNTQYITNKIPEKDELIKILMESYKKFSIK